MQGSEFEPVNQVLPIIYLATQGETPWTLSGQYTGLTDLPLTERGERNARQLSERLRALSFTKVLTSGSAGLGARASWPGLDPWQKPGRTWSNGIVGITRGDALGKSSRTAGDRNCSATAAREVNRQPTSLVMPVAW